MPDKEELKRDYEAALSVLFVILKMQSKDDEISNNLIVDLESGDEERQNKAATLLILTFEKMFLGAVEYLAFHQKAAKNEKGTIS